MFAAALGVKLNVKLIDQMAGEHRTPAFRKINPEHMIPTIVDNGFALWESRAIMIYLQEKYGKDDSFYPKDPKARAVINQRLYFDMGSLAAAIKEHFRNQLAGKESSEANLKRVEEVLGFLDGYLEGNDYVANNKLSIADFAILATVSSIEVFGFDVSPYANVARWLEAMKASTPGYELNQAGLDAIKQMLKK